MSIWSSSRTGRYSLVGTGVEKVCTTREREERERGRESIVLNFCFITIFKRIADGKKKDLLGDALVGVVVK